MKQNGQSALFIVLMISIVTTTMAYFALSRNSKSQILVIHNAAKARAAEALDSAAQFFYHVYVTEASCDPGVFNSSPHLRPIALSASRKIRGYVVSFSRANAAAGSQGYNAPYNQPHLEYYAVSAGPVHTLERIDLRAYQSRQDILYYDGASGGRGNLMPVSLGQSSLGTARSPTINATSDGPENAYDQGRSLGARDLSIELSVAYPPGPRPQFLLRQTVVFHNTCSMAIHRSGNQLYGGYYYNIPDALLFEGIPPRTCNSSKSLIVGNIADDSRERKAKHIDIMKSYLKTGAFESSLMGPVVANNCADINRDGTVTESDLGLLEKHLSGYIFYIPPIFPEFLSGTKEDHKLTDR